MFMIDVTHVKYIDHHNLEISFADGLVGIVDIDKIVPHYDGVFEPLSNLKFFAQVSVESELGTIVWPNGADLCPDVLYAHASGQSQRLLERQNKS
jgi:Protein of unknown function (DUF2442)